MPKDGSHTVFKGTVRIVSSYVSSNKLASEDIPLLIISVFKALRDLESRMSLTKQISEEEYILCLEDGKKYRSLTRHLRAAYGMSPDDYRKKWNLSSDYPMTAPGYSKLRSKIAKNSDFGNHKR